MKIVIDIDESILNDAKNGYVRLGEIADAVLSGTPLPKGHGKLVVKEERPQGEWIRKEDVRRSIVKQYTEHNELVPIWLRI